MLAEQIAEMSLLQVSLVEFWDEKTVCCSQKLRGQSIRSLAVMVRKRHCQTHLF